MGSAMKRQSLVVVLFPDTQVLDIAGPVSVFEGANTVLPKSMGYDIKLVASFAEWVQTSGCIAIKPHDYIQSISVEDVDTLIVPGGSKGTPQAMKDFCLRKLLSAADSRGVRIASICTGAFILANAGVLDGRKCTTHWAEMAYFRRLFPGIEVLTDVIFHNEDHVWTSAGVTTGIDMSLAMVARDFGQRVAQKVARNLILYMARPGHLPQISEFIGAVPSIDGKLEELVLDIKTKPAANHQVTHMAERCNMSVRSFTRRFKHIYGQTPAAMVREVRVARAEFYMQTTAYSQKRIANLVGFSSPDVMRQAINSVRRARRAPGSEADTDASHASK